MSALPAQTTALEQSGFNAARRLRYFIAFTREQGADHAPNVRLIVGDEDYRHYVPRS